MTASRNWTIVQIMYRDPVPVDSLHPLGWRSRCEGYVVNEGLKRRAERVVKGWLEEDASRRAHLAEIHYSPRGYVDTYRALTAAGRVIA